MTVEHHEKVRQSWALVAPLAGDVAQVFYANLFRMDPSTKPLFVGNMELQGRKLVETLGFIVDHLDAPDDLMPAARDLAIRHVSYGVPAEHYASVGAALIKTFKQVLGPQFTSEDEASWVAVYTGLTTVMLDAAYPT